MTRSESFEWHEQTPEGDKRYTRVAWTGRDWTFETTLKSEPEWYPVTEPTIEQWEQLRDYLFRKYQRHRLNRKLLDHVDKRLEELREAAGKTAESDEEV